MDKKIYPEVCSLEEFDRMPWKHTKQFGLDSDLSIKDVAIQAKEYAKKTGGIIYTQVDGDIDRVYFKGMHLVNRTGIFEVVKL